MGFGFGAGGFVPISSGSSDVPISSDSSDVEFRRHDIARCDAALVHMLCASAVPLHLKVLGPRHQRRRLVVFLLLLGRVFSARHRHD